MNRNPAHKAQTANDGHAAHPHLGNNVLEVSGVWKKFSKTRAGTRRDLYYNVLRSFFGIHPLQAQLHEEEFWAVQDVSFNLPRGSTLGVLGLNGAGKTTLLNMIGGMMQPDRGYIKGVGAVGALMNMAAGLQPALTARENIFVGGAVRGWSKQETLEKFDEIISFAELAPHLDRRLVDFSSGMRMRLAFSIAIHMNPDLLLVDEVLAVGDHSFREKCQVKLSEITQDAAVIIVSHSVRDIRSYCDCVLLLKDGRMDFFGDVEEGLARLLESYHHGAIKSGDDTAPKSSAYVPQTYLATASLKDVKASITSENNSTQEGNASASCQVKLSFTCRCNCAGLSLGLALYGKDRSQIIAATTANDKQALPHIAEGTRVQTQARLDLSALAPGEYTVQAVIAQGDEILYDAQIGTIERQQTGDMVWGLVHLPTRWDMQIDTPTHDDASLTREEAG